MKKYPIFFLSGTLVLFVLYGSSLLSYLLFHCIAEGISIVISYAIFMIAWNSRRFLDNHYFLFIGIAYLFIGGLDFLHTLSYSGMNIFAGITADVPTQFWIAARYLQSLSLLIAPVFLRQKLRPNFVLTGYTLVFILLVISIFYWKIFPVCLVEGTGLTPFKKVSEYLIALILLVSVVFLLFNRERFDRKVLQWLVGSFIVTILSELSFTLYVDPYGLFNLIGHYFKLIAFWCIYKAIIETGLKQPYNLLFREVKQSEARYQSLFRHMLNGFARHRVLFDSRGEPVDYIFLEVNDAFEKLTGLNKANLIGRKVTEALPGIEKDPADWIGTYGRVAATGKPVQFENYSELLDRWYAVTAFSPEKGYFASIFEDITKRKQAEEILRNAKDELEIRVRKQTERLFQSKELLESIIDHIPAMLCFYDPEGQIKFINNAFQSVLGWDLESAGNENMFDYLFPDPAVRAEVRSAMRESKPEWRDLTVRTRAGHNLETSWVNVKLSDDSMIAIGIDITERKKYEAQMRQYMDQLERSNRELQDFAFVASHDLHEPLRKIRFFGDVLVEKYSGVLDETGRDYIARMQNAAARMQQLIDSLLTFSRVTTQTTPFSGCSLGKAVQAALVNLEIRIRETGASVETGELPVLAADSNQITQLFQNLIGNALKFHRDDVPPQVKIYARAIPKDRHRDAPAYDIFVEDNGIGFDEKYLERIFQLFQRLHGRDKYQGVGMGLAICQKIVERHGGSITARSFPGKGATFIVRLPESSAREAIINEESKSGMQENYHPYSYNNNDLK